ncbi:riboflavin synthase [Oceanobacillus manasiensis]|uniref:riboflavin synthase n=1 Tax=Oceanobacillus manasiensis TaxID=586413 RepID=UPI0005A814A5|nr:riboflavin synthase [Oceanobacillus manasiensis]
MFTGIIEEKGILLTKKRVSERAVTLSIKAEHILSDMRIGDSIAINGVCLTVTRFSDTSFDVDVMPETIKATSLNATQLGDSVNLERAMAANGRFGGHFVSGHVDSTAEIVHKVYQENAIYFRIKIPESYKSLLLKKGSITVDGISLTIFEVQDCTITISIIPHTAEQTTLGAKVVGDLVNIECDMLAKQVQHLLQVSVNDSNNNLNKNFLHENGFL